MMAGMLVTSPPPPPPPALPPAAASLSHLFFSFLLRPSRFPLISNWLLKFLAVSLSLHKYGASLFVLSASNKLTREQTNQSRLTY